MEKKYYIKPRTVVVEIEVLRPLATSQFNTSVNPPSDEVDASDALSRDNSFSWDE